MSEVSSVAEAKYEGDERLTDLERILMLLPLLGGLVFGLLPYLVTGWFANITGAPGNDHYIYRLAGAATIGYVVGIGGALVDGRWSAMKLPLIATLTFNLASLVACAGAIIAGNPTTVMFLILVTSLLIIGITAFLLNNHRNAATFAPDVAQWATYVVIVALIVDVAFGLLLLFFGEGFGKFFGYKATDLFLYGQAGAATLGYGVMGIFQLRYRAWAEWKWAVPMAATFNALAVVASLWSIYKSSEVDPLLLPLLLAIGPGAVTIALLLIIQREGK